MRGVCHCAIHQGDHKTQHQESQVLGLTQPLTGSTLKHTSIIKLSYSPKIPLLQKLSGHPNVPVLPVRNDGTTCMMTQHHPYSKELHFVEPESTWQPPHYFLSVRP